MAYSQVKKLAKGLIPKRLLLAAEPTLRKLYSFAYRGNAVQCPVCASSYSQFIPLPNGTDTLCPGCGSLPRNRLLWLYLDRELGIKNNSRSLLHFSPARSLKRKLRNLENLAYTTCDYSKGEDKQFDITAIDSQSMAYDLVICYHVLEHITEDRKAMGEVYRILKKGGKALLQVPLKEGDTYEDPSVTSPEGRLQHFGQEDHVRIYGREDFVKRLRQTGFIVTPLSYAQQLGAAFAGKNGLSLNEAIFVCERPVL